MILHEIYKLLKQIDRKLDALGAAPESNTDEWIQKGLNSIMSFQAGKKKGAEE